jgi:hypothetical protein
MTKNKEKVTEEEKHRDTNHEKWDTFTYCGNEVNYITKLFKGTDIKTA